MKYLEIMRNTYNLYYPVSVSFWGPCIGIIQELSMPVLHTQAEKSTNKGCIIDHCLSRK
jgi:hypothetical protein